MLAGCKFCDLQCKVTLVIEFQIHNGRSSVSRILRQSGFPLANLFGWIDVFSLRTRKGTAIRFSTLKSYVRVVR